MPCLTPEQIEQLVHTSAEDPGTAPSQRHAEQCERCRRSIEEAILNEQMLRLLRHYPNEPPAQAEAHMPAADLIEGFEILREIGRGGQAVVYEAIQKTTKRSVALKLLREGPFISSSNRRRFEREVELAARLKHPNIVTIHDSGECEGRFFLAMDFIRGESLKSFLATHRLPRMQALLLFARICNAVAYAHRHGVIHRDLNPRNILVDADGEPHLVDFGLARAADTAVLAQSLVSMPGLPIGTLPYMAPEQARGELDAIDTRTDVYALGVILYEMLTGRFPYAVVGHMAEVLRNIAEADPQPPSVSDRTIDNDVETIVLQSLAKDPVRRYQSADALGADVARYLSGEPIEAKRDSTLYVLGKVLRKYRVALTIAATFFVLVVSALAVSTALWRTATREKEFAQVQWQRADSESEARRRALYRNQIALSEAEYTRSNIGKVQQLLALCPVDLRDWEWGRLRLISDQALRTLRGHTDRVMTVAFCPDGRHVASASFDGTIRVWSVGSGEEILRLGRRHDPVWTVAYSPDGSMLASGDDRGNITLWDATTGEEARTLRGHQGHVWSVSFSPDGTRLVSGGHDQAVRIWDVADGTELHAAGMHDSYVTSVAFSPDGSKIASCSDGDSAIKVWAAASGALVNQVARDEYYKRINEGPPYKVTFHPDGQRILTCAASCSIWFFDAQTLDKQMTIRRAHDVAVDAVAISGDGRRIVSGSRLGELRVWNAENGAIELTLRGHLEHVESVAFSPDGSLIASASWDGTIKLWDSHRNGEEIMFRHPRGLQIVTDMALSADGARLVSSSPNGTLGVWDCADWRLLHTYDAQAGPIWTVDYDPRGRHIVCGGEDRKLRVWDCQTHECIAALSGHSTDVTAVAYCPNGRTILSGDNAGTLLRWDTGDLTAAHATFGNHADTVQAIGLSPDGMYAASASADGTAKIWNTHTQTLITDYREHDTPVDCIAFSPDGQRIASGDNRGCIHIWHPVTGQILSILEGHRRAVHDVAFNHRGTRLFSAGHDWTARVWDPVSAETLLTLRPSYGGPLGSVEVTPDDRTIVVGASFGGKLIVWNALPWDERDDLLDAAQAGP